MRKLELVLDIDENSVLGVDFYLKSLVEQINKMAEEVRESKQETANFKAELPTIQHITPYLIVRYGYNRIPDTLEEVEAMRQQDMETYEKNIEPRCQNALLYQRIKDIFITNLKMPAPDKYSKKKTEKCPAWLEFINSITEKYYPDGSNHTPESLKRDWDNIAEKVKAKLKESEQAEARLKRIEEKERIKQEQRIRLGIFAVQLDLNPLADLDEVREKFYQIYPVMALAGAMFRARNYFDYGGDVVGYLQTAEGSIDADEYSNILEACNNFDGDGRTFRDTLCNYNYLYSKYTPEQYAGLIELLNNMDSD